MSPEAKTHQAHQTHTEAQASTHTEPEVTETAAEKEAREAQEQFDERNEELLSLSGTEREDKRAQFAQEDAEAGVTLTPEEQRIKDDKDTAAPVGHIPTG